VLAADFGLRVNSPPGDVDCVCWWVVDGDDDATTVGGCADATASSSRREASITGSDLLLLEVPGVADSAVAAVGSSGRTSPDGGNSFGGGETIPILAEAVDDGGRSVNATGSEGTSPCDV